MPIEVVAITAPVALVERMLLGSPRFRLVVEAVTEKISLEAVRLVVEAPPLKLCSPVQVLAPKPILLRQLPFTEKHPPAILMPLAKVEVAVFDTLRFCTERLPEKVEVELVPRTLRKP